MVSNSLTITLVITLVIGLGGIFGTAMVIQTKLLCDRITDMRADFGARSAGSTSSWMRSGAPS